MTQLTNSRLGQELVAYLADQPLPMRVLQVQQSMGGRRLDYATLEYDEAREGLGRGEADRLHDLSLIDQFGGETIEIVRASDERVVHWGKLGAVNIDLDRDGARYHWISRTEHYHFGEPLRGMPNWARFPGGFNGPYTLPEPVAFNPLIAGRPHGNMLRESDGRVWYWLDWRASQTGNALDWNRQPRPEPTGDEVTPRAQGDAWTLAKAVSTLCWTLNGDEAHIANPGYTIDQLELLLRPEEEGEHSPILRDRWLPLGMYLPECLDELLGPYGFEWFVRYQGRGRRSIDFARRGRGLLARVSHQRHGETINVADTNVLRAAIRYDVGARLVNRALVLGAFAQVENTWELKRGWDHALSGTAWRTLAKSAGAYEQQPELQDAWRLWVLGESADRVGLTDIGSDGVEREVLEPEEIEIDLANQDLHGFTQATRFLLPRRHRFLPCIARNDAGDGPAGELGGFRLSYSVDGGLTRRVVQPSTFGDVRILDDRAGIRFEGDNIPLELWKAGSQARLYLTAALELDVRLHVGTSDDASPNPDLVEAVLDVGNRYAFRRILEGSDFYSDVANGTRQSDEVDDWLLMYRFATDYVAAWSQAEVSGAITIDGLDRDFEIGQIVPLILGRNIDLTASRNGLLFPQIVAISWDGPGQQQVLTLTSFRGEVALR